MQIRITACVCVCVGVRRVAPAPAPHRFHTPSSSSPFAHRCTADDYPRSYSAHLDHTTTLRLRSLLYSAAAEEKRRVSRKCLVPLLVPLACLASSRKRVGWSKGGEARRTCPDYVLDRIKPPASDLIGHIDRHAARAFGLWCPSPPRPAPSRSHQTARLRSVPFTRGLIHTNNHGQANHTDTFRSPTLLLEYRSTDVACWLATGTPPQFCETKEKKIKFKTRRQIQGKQGNSNAAPRTRSSNAWPSRSSSTRTRPDLLGAQPPHLTSPYPTLPSVGFPPVPWLCTVDVARLCSTFISVGRGGAGNIE
ncbi:hypothetical protein C8R45DRAFT_1082085 [Mycena sanguinolenta]|nr:hypothetical protein C8R45DRAFT_1082085 [Mycena sanguinolenta]